jgi:hypothetical protein
MIDKNDKSLMFDFEFDNQKNQPNLILQSGGSAKIEC